MSPAAKCMAPLIHGEGCDCGTSLSAWREKPVLFTPAPSAVFTNDVTKPASAVSAVSGAAHVSAAYATAQGRSITMSHFGGGMPTTGAHSMRLMSTMLHGSSILGADFVYSDQEIERHRTAVQVAMMQKQQEYELKMLYAQNAFRGKYM